MHFFKGSSPKEADMSHDKVAAQNTPATLPKSPNLANIDNFPQEPARTLSPSGEKEITLLDHPSTNTSFSDAMNPDVKVNSSRGPSPEHNGGSNEPDMENKELVTNHGNDEEFTNEKEGESDDEKDEEEQYPNAWKLFLITVALCLCVFCVALVCMIISRA